MAGLVINEHEVPETVGAGQGTSTRVTIGADVTGHLEQAVVRLQARASAERSVSDSREEILYVVQGDGSLEIDGTMHAVSGDVGAYVAAGETYRLHGDPQGELVCVVVSAPLPSVDPEEIGERQTIVRVADQPALPAGKDREFRFVITPAVGCHGMTQFVGSIPHGRARDHYHEYDEVAYILSGDAVLHRQGEADVQLGPGSCVHFPPGMVHCVENVSVAPVRVLGVFHPPGSAAAAYHPEDN
jgi:mannose-6-phosphate isomerase-like protein (cupin superfamily)